MVVLVGTDAIKRWSARCGRHRHHNLTARAVDAIGLDPLRLHAPAEEDCWIPSYPKLIVACASALAIGVGVAPSADASGLSLTPNGLGKLKLGMSPQQAQAALGRRMTALEPAFLPSCGYTSVPSLRIAIMFLNYRVARIDVLKGSPVHAMGGIRRGDTEADVRRIYAPRVTETPHAYVTGSYLTVGWRAGHYANRGIRFETDEHGTVMSFYAGRHDAIRFVEGCA